MQGLSLQNKFRIEESRIFFESEDMRLVMIQPRVLRALGDCFYLKRIDTAFFEYLREQQDRETNEWLRNSIEADPNAREAVIQEIKELMETSSLSQEYFDKLLEDLGIDPSELEE